MAAMKARLEDALETYTLTGEIPPDDVIAALREMHGLEDAPASYVEILAVAAPDPYTAAELSAVAAHARRS